MKLWFFNKIQFYSAGGILDVKFMKFLCSKYRSEEWEKNIGGKIMEGLVFFATILLFIGALLRYKMMKTEEEERNRKWLSLSKEERERKRKKEIFSTRVILVLWTDVLNAESIGFIVIYHLFFPFSEFSSLRDIVVIISFFIFLLIIEETIRDEKKKIKEILNVFVVREVITNFIILIITVTLSVSNNLLWLLWLLGLGMIGMIRTGIHLNPKLYL